MPKHREKGRPFVCVKKKSADVLHVETTGQVTRYNGTGHIYWPHTDHCLQLTMKSKVKVDKQRFIIVKVTTTN